MMHFFLGYDNFGIMFSDIFEKDGEKQIRIYADDKNNGENELEFYLPSYKQTINRGFSAEVIDTIIYHVKTNEKLLWRLANKNKEKLCLK